MNIKKINASDYVDFNELVEADVSESVYGRVRLGFLMEGFDEYIETYVDNKSGHVELTIYLDFDEYHKKHYPDYTSNDFRHHVLTREEYAKLLTMKYVFDSFYIEFYVDPDSSEFKISFEI